MNFCLRLRTCFFKNPYFSCTKFESFCEQWLLKEVNMLGFLLSTMLKMQTRPFPKTSLYLGNGWTFKVWWNKDLALEDLFDRVGGIQFLVKLSSWRQVSYTLLWGTCMQNGVNICKIVNGRHVVISPKIVATVIGCLEEGLVFDKD